MLLTLTCRQAARAAFLAACLLLGACAAGVGDLPPQAVFHPGAGQTDGAFVMPDGARLPYRAWLPPGGSAPWAVVLALHGMNDSRDAWEMPAPEMAQAGIATIAPDQRGFGDATDRGIWPGVPALVADARAMARRTAARYPNAKLFLMGESMGGAVLMALAASPDPPKAAGWIFLAPAVWGRKEETVIERVALWVVSHATPTLALAGAPGVKIRASDNNAALEQLWLDPLTLHQTRMDAVAGLVDLMDVALASAPRVREHSLFLYGGKDELVPKRAMVAAWQTLPLHGPELGYYPDGYHMLLRDKARSVRLADVESWMRDPGLALPSGAEAAAAQWLAEQERERALPSRVVSGYASR